MKLNILFVAHNVTETKVMYQKPMEGVIGTYFKFKEFYPRPKHSLNISIKKFIGNNMERLKVESKWAKSTIFPDEMPLDD